MYKVAHRKAMRVQLLSVGSLAGFLAASCQAFVPSQSKVSSVVRGRPSPLRAFKDEKDEAALEEDTRLKIYESRRMQIRAALKSAEALRNFRLEKGTNNEQHYINLGRGKQRIDLKT